jgi:hypothetical protein
LPFEEETACKFRGDVLRIGGGSAIPSDEQLSAESKGSANHVNSIGNAAR